MKPTIEAWKRSTPTSDVFFIADPDDDEEIEAINQHGGNLLIHPGSWGRKINYGIQQTDHDLVFMSADDIEPELGWLAAAQPYLTDYQVIGINDQLLRARVQHATHFLVTREAADLPTIDNQPGPLYEGYGAWYVDDEYIATSMKRGIYIYAEDVKMNHLHPHAGKAPDDETYRKGRDNAHIDHHQYGQRCGLWM